MKKFFIGIFLFTFLACSSDEERKPLPDLPKIEIPQNLNGTYVGRIPAVNATAKLIRLELDAEGRGTVRENSNADSLPLDSITYLAKEDLIEIHFPQSSLIWKFKKTGSLQYTFLNPTNEPYLDEKGIPFMLFRLIKSSENTP